MPPVRVNIKNNSHKMVKMDDLGLNIVGNGSHLIRNSIHIRGQGGTRHYADRVKLNLRAKGGAGQGILITDGSQDALLPFISAAGKPLQPTMFVYETIVRGAGLDFMEINEKVKSGKSIDLFAKIDDWQHAINTATRLGQVNVSYRIDFADIDQDYSFNMMLLSIVKGM